MSADYIPSGGVTSLVGYQATGQPSLSTSALASHTSGSPARRSSGHSAVRHHATHAAHKQHKTRSRVPKAKADLGLEHQTF